MIEQAKLLNAGRTARLFRVPLRWLKAEADAGRMPHLRAENVYLFDPEVVERELMRRAREGSQSGGENR